MTVIHNRATSLMDALDAAMSGSDGTPKVVTIKPTWVVDVSQTDERAPRAAASRAAGWT